MKETFQRGNGAARYRSAAGGVLPTRDRVLEGAASLLSEAGFHGTHLREVCKRAGVNIAGVCYHFHSKEGLYEAVTKEAARQLAAHDGQVRGGSPEAPPEERLAYIIESLFEKLGRERAWIAKLLARELVDFPGETPGSAGAGLETDFVLLQAVMTELLGPRANREITSLNALSVLSQCVFYCIASANPQRVCPQIARRLPARATLARHVTRQLLGALDLEKEGSNL